MRNSCNVLAAVLAATLQSYLGPVIHITSIVLPKLKGANHPGQV